MGLIVIDLVVPPIVPFSQTPELLMQSYVIYMIFNSNDYEHARSYSLA